MVVRFVRLKWQQQRQKDPLFVATQSHCVIYALWGGGRRAGGGTDGRRSVRNSTEHLILQLVPLTLLIIFLFSERRGRWW